MKRLSTGKIFALCMGNFSRGMINGVITTYLLTFGFCVRHTRPHTLTYH